MTTFELNGEQVTIRGQHEHLLSALRDELDVTSPKDGCSPSGQCGCCTVLVDGKARVSCQTQIEKVAGREITTLEGLPDEELDRYAETFAACGALQCGFCTPGMIMTAVDMIRRHDGKLDEATIRHELEGNICRCTGYHNIVKAIQAAAQSSEVAEAAE